jgi:hypothetical protein
VVSYVWSTGGSSSQEDLLVRGAAVMYEEAVKGCTSMGARKITANKNRAEEFMVPNTSFHFFTLSFSLAI